MNKTAFDIPGAPNYKLGNNPFAQHIMNRQSAPENKQITAANTGLRQHFSKPSTYKNWAKDSAAFGWNTLRKIPGAPLKILGGLSDLGRLGVDLGYNGVRKVLGGQGFKPLLMSGGANPWTKAGDWINNRISKPVQYSRGLKQSDPGIMPFLEDFGSESIAGAGLARGSRWLLGQKYFYPRARGVTTYDEAKNYKDYLTANKLNPNDFEFSGFVEEQPNPYIFRHPRFFKNDVNGNVRAGVSSMIENRRPIVGDGTFLDKYLWASPGDHPELASSYALGKESRPLFTLDNRFIQKWKTGQPIVTVDEPFSTVLSTNAYKLHKGVRDLDLNEIPKILDRARRKGVPVKEINDVIQQGTYSSGNRESRAFLAALQQMTPARINSTMANYLSPRSLKNLEVVRELPESNRITGWRALDNYINNRKNVSDVVDFVPTSIKFGARSKPDSITLRPVFT